MKSLISIIIPVYNTEKFISRCIDSVSKQNYPNIEIVIINDFSKDNSERIIKEKLDLLFHCKCIVINNKENLGLSNSRNVGIHHSTGEYLFFLDSDDELSNEQVISKFYKKIWEVKADVCIAETQQVKNKQFIQNNYHLIKSKKNSLDNEIIKHYMKGEWAAIACNRLYSKQFIIDNKLSFYPRIINEDELWSFQVYLNARKVVFLREKTYYYYIGENPNSITFLNKNDMRSLEIILFEKLKALSIHKTKISHKPYSDILKYDIIQLLGKNNFNYFYWCKYYSDFNRKLSPYNIKFLLPNFIAYIIYHYNLKKLSFRNIRIK